MENKENIVCGRCGCTEYYTRQVKMHVGAYCRRCGRWIKWLKQKIEPATKRQIWWLKTNHVDFPDGISKADASNLISQRKGT